MAIEQALTEQQPSPEGQQQQGADLSEEEEQDLRIAYNLGEELMETGGFDVIESAMNTSNDPAQPIGQFFVQMLQQMLEDMPEDIQISPRIFLAEGGLVEQLMDLVQEETGLDKKTADRAEIYIASMIQQMAQQSAAQQQQAPQQPAPQGQPAMPAEQGVPMNG